MTHSIKYGILCEDIRREDNGKLIVIGMYGRDITLPGIPVGLNLAFLVAIEASAAGAEKVDIEVSLNGVELATAEGQVIFDMDGLILITLPRTVVPIREEGVLIFKARFAGAPWTELWHGPVTLRKNEGSSS